MAQISRLHADVIQNGFVGDAAPLSDELNQLVEESNSQDTRLNALESDVGALQSDLSTANGRIDSNDTDIVALQSDVSGLDARVTQNESDISDLQAATAVGFKVVSADYSIATSDKTVIVDPNAAANLAITLPDADVCQDGQVFRVINAAPNIAVQISGLIGNSVIVPGSAAAAVVIGYGEMLTAVVANMGTSGKKLAIDIGSPFGRGAASHLYLNQSNFPYDMWSYYLHADSVLYRIDSLASNVTIHLNATPHGVGCKELVISNTDGVYSVTVDSAKFWSAGTTSPVSTSFTIGPGETARLTPIKRGPVWSEDGVWMLERVTPW